jgi:sugar lactone lactonase YvrE
MLAGDVLTATPGGATRTHLDTVAAVLRARRSGGYVAAVEHGFVLLDDELRVTHRIPVFDDPEVRMNEGSCDPAGRFYCGSLAYDYRPGGGRLYRLDPDGSVQVVLDRVTIPNGLVWLDGGARALHADTGEDRIFSYVVDPATGEFGEREVFVDFADTPGSPDGTALDAEGGLWVAMWGGGAVRRYDAAGRLSAVVELPVSNPTSCAFGGPDGTTLYVTTSRQGVAAGTEPRAGQVHVVEAGVRGAQLHRFAG